jgi:hypothetical protein
MKKIFYYILAVFIVIAIGIGIYAIYLNNRNPFGKIVDGFTFNSLASASEKNGYIYAVNQKTKQNLYLTTIGLVETNEPVTLPDDSNTTTTSVGSLLNWLGNKKNNDSLANLKLSTKIKIKLDFKDAIICKTPLFDASKTIKATTSQIGTQLDKLINVNDYDFYIIIETIKAKELNYHFEKSVADDEKFKIDIKKVAKLNPEIKVEDEKNMKLHFTDTAYRVVLYKSLLLSVNNNLAGGYDIKIAQKN